MTYPIENKLVVGISSNALFDLRKEDEIYMKDGLEAYRKYQVDHKNDILEKGAAFMSGDSAIDYIPAFNISLFLATNEKDVREALNSGKPAGRILQTDVLDDETTELRVAFDFDGVIANDESEKVYQESGLEVYRDYEKQHCTEQLKAGPLNDFFTKLSLLQKLESKKKQEDNGYKKILKTAIITARNAPTHERAVNTLNSWGVDVDEMFLLGGIAKSRILNVMKPHLYFDDQMTHLDDSDIKGIPLVHIPFGITNEVK